MEVTEALPNFIIGIREALEAGLIITILLAAVRKATTDRRLARVIWFGVAGALSLSISVAIVLVVGLRALPATVQSAVTGILSILAAALVTQMIFSMRRNARVMKGEITERVQQGLRMGAAGLALTAFVAVAREALEATVFLWAASKQVGEALMPAIGAVLGIGAGLGLAYLLYKRAISLNLSKFFTYTAVLLSVIIAGVLAYGIGELQRIGILPGRAWIAWDLSATIDGSSWWMTIITAITGLTVKMTVMQVAVWLVYLVTVLVLYLFSPVGNPDPKHETKADRAAFWLASRSRVTIGVAMVLPLVLATGLAFILPRSQSTTTDLQVTANSCGKGISVTSAGKYNFVVQNKSPRVGEITLEDPTGGIIGEIETIAPNTTVELPATVPTGRFRFQCAMAGAASLYSNFFDVSGGKGQVVVVAKPPVTVEQLGPPTDGLRADVLNRLAQLRAVSQQLSSALSAGDTATAKALWTDAILIWQQSSAAYNAFGALGDAVGGPPWALTGGVNDPKFSGLRRLEYGLWRGEPAPALVPVANQLVTDIDALTKAIREGSDQVAMDPVNIPLRAHEVLEEAERRLTNDYSDLGAGTEYAETVAQIQNTRVVLKLLEGLLSERDPGTLNRSRAKLDDLERTIKANAGTPEGTFRELKTLTTPQRLAINAALSSTLEELSLIPGALEPPLAR